MRYQSSLKTVVAILFFFFFHQTISASDGEETCQDVFRSLKATKGLTQSQAPYLKMVKQLPNPDLSMAMALGDSIYVDVETYKICREMGSDSLNALAFILSHELAHFLKKHTLRNRFLLDTEKQKSRALMSVMEAPTRSQKKDIKSLVKSYQIRKNETEADLEAGFISYVAGFNSLSAGARFLEAAYQHFGLKREGGNYASLEERKLMVKEVAQQLDSLLLLYDVGNMAIVGGHKAYADLCYEQIISQCASPEILNNMAVARLEAFGDHWFYGEIDYELPLTLEAPAPFGRGGVVSHFDDPEAFLAEQKALYYETVAQLDEILALLEAAAQMNREFYQARLNQSIAHYFKYLMRDKFAYTPKFAEDQLLYAEAKAHTAKALVLKKDDTYASGKAAVYNMLAILADVNKQDEKVKLFLEKAKSQDPGAFITWVNESVIFRRLERSALHMEHAQHDDAGAIEEQILVQQRLNGQDAWDKMNDIASKIKKEHETSEVSFERKLGEITYNNTLVPTSEWLRVHESEYGRHIKFETWHGMSEKYSTLHLIRPKDASDLQINENIHHGADKEAVLSHLGMPSKSFEMPDGTYLRYRDFVLIMNGSKLEAWVMFDHEYHE